MGADLDAHRQGRGPDRVKARVRRDDYLTKPFALEELTLARALLRRRAPEDPNRARFADVTADLGTRAGMRGERSIDSRRRSSICSRHPLLRSPGQVLSATSSSTRGGLRLRGGVEGAGGTCVRYPAREAEVGGESRLIHTMRGVGYPQGAEE